MKILSKNLIQEPRAMRCLHAFVPLWLRHNEAVYRWNDSQAEAINSLSEVDPHFCVLCSLNIQNLTLLFVTTQFIFSAPPCQEKRPTTPTANEWKCAGQFQG